ncbi:MAG: hypothetical protein ACTHLH_08170 [Solirubrobacterales bacterium]
MRPKPSLLLPVLAALVVALLVAGCGSSSSADETSRPAPSKAEFPAAKGQSIGQLLKSSGAKPTNLVIAPAASASLGVGEDRYSFGVFTKGREQITDADVALYFAKTESSPAKGPYPAQVTSLAVKPAYRSRLNDPDAAQAVYVVPKVDFNAKGPWVAIAMLKGKNGLEASRVPTPVIEQYPDIPKVGEKAPLIHTPTAADVGGDLAKIDTRIPPDQMHKVDFAEVVGKKPIALIFATPALCQSRVCGPVVDVAQQVADQHKGEVDFIHMEVYNDNDPNKGIRPQLRTYNLPTEPWTFLINANGVIKDRIEGAYGVSELEEAVKKILPG